MKLYKFAIAELILKFGPFAFLFYFANVGTPGEFGEIAKLVVFFEAIYILFSFSVPSIIKIKYFKLTTVSFREYLDQLRSLIFLAFFCLGVVVLSIPFFC
jgi:L-cystine uptake protein TcyP (sodium:dicarboxylate symporter family)